MSRFYRLIACCGAVLVLAVTSPAPLISAAIVSFQLSGTLTFVESTGAAAGDFALAPDVVVGAPFTGLLTYDLSIPPQDATGAPYVQSYVLAPPTGAMGLSITVGSQTFATNPQTGFNILVSNAAPEGAYPQSDGFGFASGGYDSLGDFFESLALRLQDSSGSALSSPALPTMLNAADFEVGPFSREIQISRWSSVVTGFPPRPGAFYSVLGTIDTMALVSVPEPSTLGLGGLVLVSVAWCALLRKRIRPHAALTR